ncbi:hypothetical protein HBH56_015150 [Parastagonospora nodorum]|uniref:Uncharacterized protein n=1 Tax=Phaeosphaeria nodorum (strain SN15 / ATCC MYA-4574 / FGSC 10173) TaxID=321614 RepID=A0A7U2I057_PHANO|nr:hypothetical protein HBH56_015150 [Parastagonospora nodorum]QRC94996.1 hypothetical protein JI435_027330 [Parastagonospora nodorum SN15]KAH3937212.1 hypothetical protein HBH54_019290 [Parastagonospora nodorum]KAH3969493.1 hypothetical protein HBH51_123870 [Parastagonospora nodorum]KAH4134623.1 hypothetical protein HBH45_163840 [Parastagonospora nodorum]
MFSVYLNTQSLSAAMLFTGIILAPVALATPAVQDLNDLRTVVDAAAKTIGDPSNPNRGWGFNIGNKGMGTADLLNNITNTVLQIKFQIDTNKTAWLLPNATSPDLNTTTPTPSLPLTSSIVLPLTAPTSLVNATTDLSTPYIDYVAAIPNLATSLTSLGRAYHREMNSPVSQAIDGLQQSLTTLQTTMLQSDLIGSQAVLRTIRASSSLENAQVAWGRFLNLPGRASAGGSGSGNDDREGARKRQLLRPALADGKFYTHKELWGRSEGRSKALRDGKTRWAEAVAKLEAHRARVLNGHARVGRPFVV